jgi:hypothetical protein
MPIIQVNVFVCERCGLAVSTTKQQSLFHDPVIEPPLGWDLSPDPAALLLCRECRIKNPKPA